MSIIQDASVKLHPNGKRLEVLVIRHIGIHARANHALPLLAVFVPPLGVLLLFRRCFLSTKSATPLTKQTITSIRKRKD
jgi:hypothetical protein